MNHQPAREKELFDVASEMHLAAAGGATAIDWRGAMHHVGRLHAPERSPSVSFAADECGNKVSFASSR